MVLQAILPLMLRMMTAPAPALSGMMPAVWADIRTLSAQPVSDTL
ncbi:antigen 43 domain protein [Escherichia coli 3-105-05_S3_C3]|nr:antigen 43 domain protein [Escherichia coli 3-105-05_S3_C3]